MIIGSVWDQYGIVSGVYVILGTGGDVTDWVGPGQITVFNRRRGVQRAQRI